MKAKGTYQSDHGVLDCELQVVNGSLYIYLQDQRKSLVVWDLRMVTSCHFDGTVLHVQQAYPKQMISSADHQAAKIYEEYLAEVSGRKKFKRRTRIFVVIALFALGLAAFAWFTAIPWLAEKLSTFIPVETEISVGENLAKAVEEQNHVNDSASYYIQKFTEQLRADDTYPIEVKVIESEEVNAFALPGGKIFVYSGIIERMNSYPELAALLGHEMSHVTNRHSLKSVSRSAASSLVLSSVFGDSGGLSVDLISKVNEFKSLHYSRELETEADQQGLKLMVENKIDPQGMVDLLKLLKRVGDSQPAMMKYLSTHPDTDSRIERVKENDDYRKVFEENIQLKYLFEKVRSVL